MSAPIYFTGRARKAALQVLDNTSLGERLANWTEDEGTLLTVWATEDVIDSLSSGETALYYFVAALGGHGAVNLYDLVSRVDDDCAFHAAWALMILTGKATPVEPVEFGRAS